jgi:hypothetical protein
MPFLYFTHQSLERDCSIDTYGIKAKLVNPPTRPYHHERTENGCTHILHMDRAQLMELRAEIDRVLAMQPSDPSVADVLADQAGAVERSR